MAVQQTDVRLAKAPVLGQLALALALQSHAASRAPPRFSATPFQMPIPLPCSVASHFATPFNRDQGNSNNTLAGILKKDFDEFARSVEADLFEGEHALPL
jgi:hypothetical protein